MWKKVITWTAKLIDWSERNPDEIVSFWKRFKKRRDFLILGLGGVGKSTLAQHLAGAFDIPTNAPSDYLESLGLEEVEIPQLGATAIVPPGQELRAEVFWEDLEKDLVKGARFKGVIIVYSYGYHALARSKLEHPLYDPENVSAFTDRYTADRRAAEQKLRDKIAKSLVKRKKKFWVLEVVAKRDLWWDERDEVRAFYQPSLKEIVLEKGANLDSSKIFAECVYLSFKIDTFKTTADELLKSNVSGYTEPLQIDGFNDLNRAIKALMDWEK